MTRRRVKNDRLAAAGYLWAFSAARWSPGAATLYRRCRDAGQYHAASLRRLFHKLLGCLHHCLQTRIRYDENAAFPPIENELQLAA